MNPFVSLIAQASPATGKTAVAQGAGVQQNAGATQGKAAVANTNVNTTKNTLPGQPSANGETPAFATVLKQAINTGVLNESVIPAELAQLLENGQLPQDVLDQIAALLVDAPNGTADFSQQVLAIGTEGEAPSEETTKLLQTLQSSIANLANLTPTNGEPVSTGQALSEVQTLPTAPIAEGNANNTPVQRLVAQDPYASQTPEQIAANIIASNAANKGNVNVANQAALNNQKDGVDISILNAANDRLRAALHSQKNNTSNTNAENRLAAIAQQTAGDDSDTDLPNLLTTQSKRGVSATPTQSLLAKTVEGAFQNIQQEPAKGLQSAGGQVDQSHLLQQANLAPDHRFTDAIRTPQPLNTTLPSQGTPAEQVSIKFGQALQQGQNHVDIQLEPAHLGRVRIQIDLPHDGKAQVYVFAEKQETLDMLQRDAKALEKALQNAGVQADAGSFDFNLKHGNQQQAWTPEFGKHLQPVNENLPEAAVVAGAYRTYQLDRALDIQV